MLITVGLLVGISNLTRLATLLPIRAVEVVVGGTDADLDSTALLPYCSKSLLGPGEKL